MATFTAAARNAALTAVSNLGSWISLHNANPGTTGVGNEISGGSYARIQTTWATASAGSQAGSQVTINVPAGTTIAYYGIWSAVTGGTFVGGDILPASETYGSAGTYLLTITLTD
jgi:hypothetical protein